MNEKIIAIDGNSLFHRAYHAIPTLKNKKGQHTNAIFGFLKMILNLIKKEKPDGLVIVFDSGKTFRHKLYNEYKSNRKKIDDNLKNQFPIIMQILKYMGIKVLSKKNYEADDLLGSIAFLGTKKKDNIILITGDKDSLQLINENVSVFFTKKGLSNIEIIDHLNLMKNYKLKSNNIIEIKALEGDSSDNIKGIKGIGKKTAFDLIKKYNNLENLYKNIDDLKGNIKKNLILYKKDAFLYRKLVKINCSIPIKYTGFKYGLKYGNINFLKKILIELDFHSIISDFDFYGEKLIDQFNKQNKIVLNQNNYENLNLFLNEINKIKSSVLSVFFKEDEFNNIKYISLFDGENNFLFNNICLKNIKNNDFIKTKKILIKLISLNKKLLFFEAKSFFHLLNKHLLNMKKIKFEDISIMAYLLNSEKSYTKEHLIIEFLNSDSLEKYYTQNLYYIYIALKEKLKKNNIINVYEKIEKKLVPILASMENHGLGLNKKTLKNIEKDLKEKINILTEEIYCLAKIKFNINSNKQLTKILFETLKLPLIKKNKTGYSTNQEVLEKLKKEHPIVNLILKYRKLTKLFNTYIKKFISFISFEENKEVYILKTNFNQTAVSTGRLSSENPNLQSIPVKMKEGRILRKIFVPINKNNYFISSDYSQIELRILAHFSDDEKLKFAFKNNIDIHTQTASEIFDIDIKNVTEEMRRKSKIVNFGILYGMSEFGLSKDLNISIKKSKDYIEKYFKKYSKVRTWIDNILIKAKKELKVTTLSGRYRILNNLKSDKFFIRSAAERMAINAPIQGTAADLIKLAMIKIQKEIEIKKLKTSMVLQIHDELIFEVPKNEIKIIIKILKDKMINAIKLSIPLNIDLRIGENFYEMEKINNSEEVLF